MKHAWLVVVAALGLGCSQPLVRYELPTDAFTHEHLLVVMVDEDKNAVGSSGVFSAAATAAPLIELFGPEASSIVTLGFDGLDVPVAVPTAPLSVAGPSDPTPPLADGQWSRALSADEWNREVPSLFRLTTPWLPDCPAVLAPSQSAWIDIRCAAVRCVDVVRQSGCVLGRESKTCLIDDFDGTIRSDGTLDTVAACTIGPAPEPSRARIACADCSYDLYVEDDETWALTDSVRIYDVPYVEDDTQNAPLASYLHGLVELDEHVVVAGHGGATESGACEADAESELVFVPKDDESLAVVRTATAPPCIRDLAGGGDRLYALVGGPPIELIRLDTSGRVEARVTVESLGPASIANRVLVLDDGDLVVSLGILGGDARISIHDPETLTERRFVTYEYGFALVAAGPDALVLSESTRHRMRRVRVSDLVETGASRLEGSFVDRGPSAMLYVPATGRVHTASPGRSPAVHTFDVEDGALLGDARTTHYEQPFAPLAGTRWPPGEASVVFSGRDWNDGTAFLSRFDSEHARFLPGILPLGRGPSTRAITDADGRAWFLMAWTAHLVRVRRP